MAGVFRKATASAICRVMKTTTKSAVTTGNRYVSPAFLPSFATRSLTLSRSLWCLSSSVKQTNTVRNTTWKCGCCDFHTEADRELDLFLQKEIDSEESRVSKKVPSLKGWSVETDEAIVKLKKTIGNENILITLNVSNSIISPDDVMYDEEHAKQEDPQKLECRPPFTIEIQNSGGKTLSFDCAFRAPGDIFPEEAPAEGEHEADDFDIEDVAIYDGEIKDSTYKLDGQTMDEEMRDHLMDMLDERGINKELTSELISMLTNYESGQYVKFLHSVKAFIERN